MRGTHAVQLIIVLDTGARPNFNRKAVMPKEMALITEHEALPNIVDANGNLIRMSGREKLQGKLGSYRLTLVFIL